MARTKEEQQAYNREYFKKYYKVKKNRDKVLKYTRDYYKTHKEQRMNTQRKWRTEHPEEWTKRTRDCDSRVRNALIELLGGKCMVCGIEDYRVLQVDHINGGGSIERRAGKGRNREYLRKVIDGNKDYQLLCANCNWIKRYENNEVRKVRKSE